MSHPNPRHRPQPPGPPPPVPPWTQHSHGCPPHTGYPPVPQRIQPPPHTAASTRQPDGGDSWGWQLLEGLLIFASGTHNTGPGRTARDRVKLMVVLLTILFAVIALGVTAGIVLAM